MAKGIERNDGRMTTGAVGIEFGGQPYRVEQGDCLDLLKTMPDACVDSVVCDPPYGLSDHKPQEVIECLKAWLAGEVYVPKGSGFMGQRWDAWVPGPEVWRECLRVLKPGGHLVAFSGTRSMDLMGMSVRLAGFELRDSIGFAHDGAGAPLLSWIHGQGFPKSRDVSKAITNEGLDGDAGAWAGWGSALKPAWEPIILARKPLQGTLAANMVTHGTGGLNIDGCRVPVDPTADASQLPTMNRSVRDSCDGWGMSTVKGDAPQVVREDGRWPANVVHDGSDVVVAQFPWSDKMAGNVHHAKDNKGGVFGGGRVGIENVYKDCGSAARFFYCAKASRADRHAGLEVPAPAVVHGATFRDVENARREGMGGNDHETVKPTNLMRWLCRLVTPAAGVVLDPFMGSGSTGRGAVLEGFKFVGFEREGKHVTVARARIAQALDSLGLFA